MTRDGPAAIIVQASATIASAATPPIAGMARATAGCANAARTESRARDDVTPPRNGIAATLDGAEVSIADAPAIRRACS